MVLKVVTIESAMANGNTVCAMAGKNPVWCQDCAPGMGTPYSVINATFPTIKLVAINSNDPNDALKGRLDLFFYGFPRCVHLKRLQMLCTKLYTLLVVDSSSTRTYFIPCI